MRPPRKQPALAAVRAALAQPAPQRGADQLPAGGRHLLIESSSSGHFDALPTCQSAVRRNLSRFRFCGQRGIISMTKSIVAAGFAGALSLTTGARFTFVAIGEAGF
jgi:hypothetical protein